MASVTFVASRTTDPLLRALEGREKWDVDRLTFALPNTGDLASVLSEMADETATGTPIVLDPTIANQENVLNGIFHAIAIITQYVDLTFTASTNFDAADLKYVGIQNLAYPISGVVGGSGQYPGTELKDFSLFDYESGIWITSNLAYTFFPPNQGASDFIRYVAIHETLHALGLAHPHDADHGTATFAAEAVTVSDNPIDNERYTVMSYEFGGRDTNTSNTFGHAATPMALDLAVLDNLYGLDINTHSGATSYALTDPGTTALDINGADGSVKIGAAWYSIWDNGGTDNIFYAGNDRAFINLNPATLSQVPSPDIERLLVQIQQASNYKDLPADFRFEIEGDGNNNGAAAYYAGGFFSRVFKSADNFTVGGYSIAAGVEIEIAVGDNKGDFLIGNTLDNQLQGFGGDDYIHGYAGNDTIQGGNGDDEMAGGDGNDQIDGGVGTGDVAIFSESCLNYSIVKNPATGVVTITHLAGGRDGVDTLVNVEKARFADATVDLTVANPTCVTDFIFLVDLSGSFNDDLINFQQNASSIVAAVRADDPNARFALASFVDIPVAPYGLEGDYPYRAELPLTNSLDVFVNALEGLTTFGGGDVPEAQLLGLWNAANGEGLNLREGSRKVIMVATDAPAHNASSYGLEDGEVRAFLQSQGIEVEQLSASAPAPLASPTTPNATLPEEAAGPAPHDSDPASTSGAVPAPSGTGDGIGNLPPLREGDEMVDLIAQLLRDTGAVPIFATTLGLGDDYGRIEEQLGRGATVTISSDSRDIADAVRAGLTEINGSISETGGVGPDTLTGTEGADVLLGLGGSDTIRGLAGDDQLDGGPQDDMLFGEDGNDLLLGGTDNDRLDGGPGDDTLIPGAGIDTITLGPGADTVRDVAVGLNGDTITDFTGEDRIAIIGEAYAGFEVTTAGGASTIIVTLADGSLVSLTSEADLAGLDLVAYTIGDTFIAQAPAPRLVGTAGPEVIIGTAADDILDGQGGEDSLTGRGGADLFVIAPGGGRTAITDFEDGVDLLDLRAFARTEARTALSAIEEQDPVLRLPDSTEVTFEGGLAAGAIDEADALLAAPLADIAIERAQLTTLLYEAALNRDGNIDLEGLNFWIDQREAGQTPLELARAFVENDEFVEAFGSIGSLSNLGLAQILYRNVLNREGEAGGIAFWQSELDRGILTREEAVLAFAVSEENFAGSPFIDDLVEVAPGEWAFG